ncbi:autophagy protein 13 [Exophiala dermatitidis]|uniref:Autophagy-related protein 13 n=2 Tax=Exophiala dermatitidis TaxID=5970 RepID=H6CAC8_EXODN|nr:autophagy-like protein 13 [Exophiala dermatitidis NIH/UT8656]KAJ4503630.1 autophagy protein 13 [Exophiala dermatitidis]EHY60092.1 autophagy-like protein 13 [Exophiala dermatitidis NIH/UT8656]KAJ4504553.1 autophagy protein 13 [Exophiala dermatitidis]KAJ4505362.1 autophagy protein 13 [Exophiala dermatitidis]KAJ4530651.1 autophagy protein 13 [Exophiala dermatitidis]
MHQHPRPPPVTASPANSEQTNPTRTNNPRDRDLQALRTTSPLTQGSGSSEDFANARQDSPADNPGVQMQRLNQVIQNFHTKAALIILQSRVELSPAYSQKTETKRVNRWFNLDIDETHEYRDDIKRWKTCDVEDNRPPPLVIEVFLTTDPLQQGQRLVIVDEDGKRWDVMTTLSSRNNHRRMAEANEVILERWTIQLGDATGPVPPDLATLLPLVYKKSIVFFRSLYTYSNFLPAWKLSRKIGKSRSTMAMKIGYRIVDGSQMTGLSRPDNLNLRLFDSNSDVLSSYDFGMTDSPAGPFSVKVDYRQNCDFRIDDSEELLSSRFLGADDDLFRPSLPVNRAGTRTTEVGSLPTDRRQHLLESPELGLAYGSLSTFHQAGIASGTSPISALRNAQEFDTSSPPTPEPARQTVHSHTTTAAQPSRTSLRAVAANRRSSFSVHPFKTPTLSASPLGVSPLASSPRTHSARVPTLGSLTEEGIPPPAATAPVTLAGRRAGSLTSDNAVASSTSSSPKPAPVTRYSSSFSHRRARLSSGGTTARTDDDQTSSGRGSAASSAQPGSGLMTEPATGGGSSGSVAEDDGENISEFLKMIELQKDLLSSPSSAAAEASTRRTAAALNRFHRMRESNAALSESMSSSLMLQRSSGSSSRQLSGVPPMVAGTSISTSSSPGKPISPHTPHTPFAPSRLSAAYSHDDGDTPHRFSVGEEAPSPSDAPTEETAQAESSTANVNAIDIPNSPRPFLPGYPRSSSAQRQRPLNDADDDVAGFYGMRSASMGADRRRGHGHGHRREAARADDDDDGGEERPVESTFSSRRHRPNEGSVRRASHQAVPHRHSGLATATPLGASDGTGSEPEPSDLSARASVAGEGPPAGSTTNTNTSYLARQRITSRPHQAGGSGSGPGSSSSRLDSGANSGGGGIVSRGSDGVGDEDGPGNSVQVGGDGHGVDAGSTGSEPTSSWAVRGSGGGGHHGHHHGSHHRRHSRASVVSNLSRPAAGVGLDEDDFLPFAMEKSDFNMGGKA